MTDIQVPEMLADVKTKKVGRPCKFGDDNPIWKNRDYVAQYQRDYQLKRRQEAGYDTCECGMKYNKYYKQQHTKGKFHQLFMIRLNDIQTHINNKT